MRVTLLGVRGSVPVSASEFLRHGGHTSCVAIAHDGQPPSLVLDAGTGIRRLRTLLGGEPLSGSILLGHMHWDHTQGIPFADVADHPRARVRLFAPAQGGGGTEALLRGLMSPPHFPITPSGLRGWWDFVDLEEGEHTIEGFTVLAREIPHKGGRTFGYRVSDGDATVAYLSDHCPTVLGTGPDGLGEYHEAAMALAGGCDLLLHDSQWTDEELPARAPFGHASAGYAVALARRAGVRRLLLYHHDPSRTDDQVDAITARYQGLEVAVTAAVEEMQFDLPEPAEGRGDR